MNYELRIMNLGAAKPQAFYFVKIIIKTVAKRHQNS
jgi:hypothetical protein